MDLRNKVALVTGAGRGIGKATALALAKAGANLIITSRTAADLQIVSREAGNVGRKTMLLAGDITRESFIRDLVHNGVTKMGRLDVVINNAGVGRFGAVAEMSTQEWDEMFNVNLRAAFLVIRETLPQLRKQSESFIVNVASLAAKNFFAKGSGYAATKWGLMALSKCLMLEEREHGVRVLAICPGSVDTHFFDHPSLPKPDKNKILKADDVAFAIVSAIHLPQRAMISELEIRPSNP